MRPYNPDHLRLSSADLILYILLNGERPDLGSWPAVPRHFSGFKTTRVLDEFIGVYTIWVVALKSRIAIRFKRGWRDTVGIGEVDTKKDHDKTHKEGNNVSAIKCVEGLVEDEESDGCSGRAANVVHRDYDIGGKGIKGFVEVFHLNKDANDDSNAEDVSTWVSELVFAAEGEFDCYTETFSGYGGDGTGN